MAAAAPRATSHGAHPAPSSDGQVLSSQLVRFQAEGDAATTVPASGATVTTTTTTTTTTAPTEQAPARVSAPELQAALAPSVTTTTPPPAPTDREEGQATWYAAALPGRCASPTLPFGTVLTVTSNATGARTVCTVDDREQAGYPHVVDLSPSGFAQLAGLGRGVVDVTISW